MRIIGSLVVRNERDRYLRSCINHHKEFLDEIFVYDDDSDDGTPEIAEALGCTVERRPSNGTPFLEHEAAFRYAAWQALEERLKPEPGDWIFSFDADEFLVATEKYGEVRPSLDEAIAKAPGCSGIILPVKEIFCYEGGVAHCRTDGFWGGIAGSRLFAYRAEAGWNWKKMGCGSEPTYVGAGPLSHINVGLHILHFGYAVFEDRVLKYERYSSTDHGHNDSHIQSILQRPVLQSWRGPLPELT